MIPRVGRVDPDQLAAQVRDLIPSGAVGALGHRPMLPLSPPGRLHAPAAQLPVAGQYSDGARWSHTRAADQHTRAVPDPRGGSWMTSPSDGKFATLGQPTRSAWARPGGGIGRRASLRC